MSETDTSRRTWVVARFGAYMHYAVPRILHHAGLLERLYTDFYAGDAGTWMMNWIPARFRPAVVNRMLGRRTDDIPRDHIRSFPMLGLEYFARQARATDTETRSAAYLVGGKKFGRMVAEAGFGNAGAVFTFNTAALEILRAAKDHGLFTAMEQCIAPRAYEEEILGKEEARYPGWEPPRVRGPSTRATIEREREEWALADIILCGSEFVKHGVACCGGPVERCMVVPYGVDTKFISAPRTGRDGPLRVLTVGEAGLRKGVTYAMEAAQMLGADAEFRWVGGVPLLPSARAQVEKSVQLTGAIPRSEMRAQFEWADVFFLPSVCEGSATVTYEALMSGLPVVTTPNTGSLVRDGVDGFVVPVRDTKAMAEKLSLFCRNRDLLRKMGEAAAAATNLVSLDAYGKRLLAALGAADSRPNAGHGRRLSS